MLIVILAYTRVAEGQDVYAEDEQNSRILGGNWQPGFLLGRKGGIENEEKSELLE
jgi:hypothetical protein